MASESYDIAGGSRDRYRAVGDEGVPVEGIGKNGHLFRFKNALTVDSSGVLSDGTGFDDINGLKKYLLRDERAIARNWVNQLVVYSTGAPVAFADRAKIERILDAAEEDGYRMRSLIHGVVASPLFQRK